MIEVVCDEAPPRIQALATRIANDVVRLAAEGSHCDADVCLALLIAWMAIETSWRAHRFGAAAAETQIEGLRAASFEYVTNALAGIVDQAAPGEPR